MNFKRIYVSKKDKFAVEESYYLNEFESFLKIKTIEKIKLLNRYDISNLNAEVLASLKKYILADENLDLLYDDFDFSEYDYVLAFEYLPGQFDLREDFIKQNIQLLNNDLESTVLQSKILLINGKLSEEEKTAIKTYCINSVDSKEVSLSKRADISEVYKKVEKVKRIKLAKGKKNLISQKEELGLAMPDDDFIFLADYFNEKEKRDPSITEILVLDTYWSDHCRHTTFTSGLKEIIFNDGKYKDVFEKSYKKYLDCRQYLSTNKHESLMDMAVMAMKCLKKQGKLDDMEISDEVNAASIEIIVDNGGKDEIWLLMFKNETHNHPTEIEPLGGASTCLGGAIRDPLSGRAYVYQAMRVTGAANPNAKFEDSLDEKLSQRKICKQAALGYSSYGNGFGLAAGEIKEYYHPGYIAKRMELGALLAAVKKDDVLRAKPEKGDIILLLGGKTGRDGVGGATGSSDEQTAESLETSASAEVQKGNPGMQKPIQKLFRRSEISKIIKKSNDFGAGGVSVAVGELADSLIIDLDKVPVKYSGLDGTELAISESQERMAVVIDPKYYEFFKKASDEEGVECSKIAEVTDDLRVVMLWQGDKIVDFSREFLDSERISVIDKVIVDSDLKINFFEDLKVSEDLIAKDIRLAFFELLGNIKFASQKGLSQQFDYSVGGNTVLAPLGGKNEICPLEAMVAKIPVKNADTKTVSMMAHGFNPFLSQESPYHGAYYAVLESIAKLIATGADAEKIRLSFQEFFERLRTAEKWGKPLASLLGALEVQLALEAPSIGGKDSMSGSYMDIDVPPTLVSFAVRENNIENIISPEFKKPQSKVVFFKLERDENSLVDLNKFRILAKYIHKLIKEKKIISVMTVKEGGLVEAIAKMCLGNNIGFSFNKIERNDLFKAEYCSFVCELNGDIDLEFDCIDLGRTISDKEIVVDGEKIELSHLSNVFLKNLENIYPMSFENEIVTKKIKHHKIEKDSKKMDGYNVLLAVLPGSSGEEDIKKSFQNTAAKVVEQTILFNTKEQYEKSLNEFIENLNNSQILVLPSGFSYDEPVNSGKTYLSFLLNEKVKTAVENFIQKENSLILALGNSANAVLKLGLLENEKYSGNVNISLAKNPLNTHVSRFVDVKNASSLSAIVDEKAVGQKHSVHLSSLDGSFVLSEETFDSLNENGQIISYYIDDEENIASSYKSNPLASDYAIEGISSKNGKVIAKISSIDRFGEGLYKNISNENAYNPFLILDEYFGS